MCLGEKERHILSGKVEKKEKCVKAERTDGHPQEESSLKHKKVRERRLKDETGQITWNLALVGNIRILTYAKCNENY